MKDEMKFELIGGSYYVQPQWVEKTNKEKLDNIPDEEIERYIRKKKLKKIKNN